MSRTASRLPRYIVPALLLAIALGGLAVYGLSPGGNGAAMACPGSAALAERLKPLAKGDLAALNVKSAPEPLVPLIFKRPDDSGVAIADFKGRTVLLNLWATWCAPCREEIPALDEVQAKLGSDRFEVVAINIDQRNLDRVGAFLDEVKATHLTRYHDATAGVFADLRTASLAVGMPTTLLVDDQGCLLARLDGYAKWASPDALALLEAATTGRNAATP